MGSMTLVMMFLMDIRAVSDKGTHARTILEQFALQGEAE